MPIKLRGGTFTEDRRLDRLIEFDPRSKDFPIRTIFRRPKQWQLTGSQVWFNPLFLDQGQEGACVGFAFAHEMASDPISARYVTTAKAIGLYHTAQQLDGYPGGSYPGADPIYEGTTILAGAKAAYETGYLKEYRWAFSEEELAEAILTVGPAVLGLVWTEGMFNTDRNGFIRPTGRVQGGHAIEAIGVVKADRERTRTYVLRNSWGPAWGEGGNCYVTARDMKNLLSRRGEACIPITRVLRY